MSFKIDHDGDLVWRNEKGECHREKGPAVIFTSGYISYYLNGQLHRLYGPSAISANGNK